MASAQIISAMTSSLCPLIDSIVVGRFLGVSEMSAYGISSPVIIVFAALGTMLVNGVQVQLGKKLGSGDRDGMDECFATSVIISLILAGAGMLLVFAFGDPLCSLLGAGETANGNVIFTLTRDYLRGYMLGIPFFFLGQILSSYLQSMGKQKLLVASVAAMIVTDVIFDLISVMLNGGMFGIGLASGLSFLASFAVGILYFINKDCPFHFSLKAVKWLITKSIVISGSPVLFTQVMYTLRVLFFNLILIGIGGTDAVAAFAVIFLIIWRKYGRVSFSLDALSFLGPEFGAGPDECMELSITDEKTAVSASEKLCGFCRDNCISFDPTKYLELHQDSDPTAHIGIRMIMGMVKEADYVNTLGLNNLTLVI